MNIIARLNTTVRCLNLTLPSCLTEIWIYNSMSLIKVLFIGYLIFVMVLLHSSLLFCTQSHCIIPLTRPPLSPEYAYYIRYALVNLLPFSIKTVQDLAQWLVVIELVFLFWWFLQLIKKAIFMLFEIIFLFLLGVCIYNLYLFWLNNPTDF